MNTAAQQLGRTGGLAKSKAKTAAVRENGKLGGRPKKPKPEWVFIYALKLNRKVLYVGSSFDVPRRAVLHANSGKLEIQEAIKNGAKFVTLKKVPFDMADDVETETIKEYILRGECKFNSMMKSHANAQRLGVTFTNIVRHKRTHLIYRSAAAAARAHHVAPGTVANHCKNGGDFEFA